MTKITSFDGNHKRFLSNSTRKTLFAVGASLQLIPSGALYAQAKEKQPNILFIYTDDQRFDALSAVQEVQEAKARFPWFKTPNIDRIANEGVRFTNSFVTTSLSSPSRAAFLTGQYSHLSGIVDNHTELIDTTKSTYASEIQKAGYTTGFIGKWHMSNQEGKRPGFDYSFSFIGQGRYNDCPYQLNGKEFVNTKGWVDDVSTDSALTFIKRNEAKPFLLSVAFKSSHANWTPPERLAKAYSDVSLTRSASEGHDTPYKDKVYSRWNQRNNKVALTTEEKAWTEKNDEMIRNYFRVLKGVDENVGRILDLLDSLHLAENTVVIYSTDNGYYLGEHNLGDKRSAYEESLRTPLLVRYPNHIAKNTTNDKFVLNVDIAPTILDYANVKRPDSFQGKSWKQLLEGNTKDWRTSFFYEYFYENIYNTPTVLAVRTETAKLVKYPGQEDWSELFDLSKDPNELHNLYNEKSAVGLKKQLTKEFEKQQKEVQYFYPTFADERPIDENGKYTLTNLSKTFLDKIQPKSDQKSDSTKK